MKKTKHMHCVLIKIENNEIPKNITKKILFSHKQFYIIENTPISKLDNYKIFLDENAILKLSQEMAFNQDDNLKNKIYYINNRGKRCKYRKGETKRKDLEDFRMLHIVFYDRVENEYLGNIKFYKDGKMSISDNFNVMKLGSCLKIIIKGMIEIMKDDTGSKKVRR